MKTLIFSLITFLFGIIATAQKSVELYPYRSGKLWGYVDNKNILRIPCQYLSAEFFNNNLAKVGYEKDGNTLYGFINKNGQLVIKDYKYVSNFDKGVAIVADKSSESLIDTTGKPIITGHDGIRWLDNDYFIANIGQSYYLYDIKGKLIHSEVGYRIRDFNGKYAIIDDAIDYFSEETQSGLVDIKGKHVIPLSTKIFNELKGNYICYSEYTLQKTGSNGLMDINGNIIIGPWEYESNLVTEYRMKEGFCIVQKNNSALYGFVDSTGKLAIPLMYQFVTNFNNGYAVSKSNGKFGIINKQNKTIVPFNYDSISDISENKVIFTRNKKQGVMTVTGKEICNNYISISSFSDGFAIASLDGVHFGIIDSTGKVTVNMIYNEITLFHNNTALFKKAGKVGVLNKAGKEVVVANYDLIDDGSEYSDSSNVGKISLSAYDENGFALLQKVILSDYGVYKESLGYIDLNGKEYFDDGINLKAKYVKSYPNICEAIENLDIDAIKNIIESGTDLNKEYEFNYVYNGNIYKGKAYPFYQLVNKLAQNSSFYDLFKLFIENDFDINMKFESGSIPVAFYLLNSDKFKTENVLSMLDLLFKKNYDFNSMNNNNINAINIICMSKKLSYSFGCEGTYEIAKFLIEHGSDPFAKDFRGYNALKFAKETNCDDLVKLIKSYKK